MYMYINIILLIEEKIYINVLYLYIHVNYNSEKVINE